MVKSNTLDIESLSERGLMILNSAQELFFNKGFDETSLEMIINKAGGSRRSIYNEFGDKQGLLMAVIQRQVTVQTEIFTTIDRNLAAKAALNKVCFEFVKGMLSPELMSLFRLVVQQVVKFPQLGEMIYQKGPLAGILPLTDYLKHLAEEKIIVADDFQFSAQMLIEMAKGPLHTRSLLLPDKVATNEEIEHQVAQAVEIFLNAHQC